VANPFLPATFINAEMNNRYGISVANTTIRSRLRASGLLARHAAKKPFISAKNRVARLAFAREHLHWTVLQWKQILWSDESRFQLFRSDGLHYVRRPIGHRFTPRFLQPTVKHGGGSLMVWGCFHGGGLGPLVQIHGIMDRFYYRDILNDYMVPYADDNMPLTFTFQHDNDPKHSSKLVREWLLENHVRVLLWPAQSPDLNPIEHLWDYVSRRLSFKNCTNLQQLFAAAKDIWSNIPSSYIEKLVSSMHQRCRAVISARGYPTSY
jgi:hypothetical protein